jgi:hypothetical protein
MQPLYRATLLPVMRNDTFYTNTIVRKKRGGKWRHFRSRDFRSCHIH